MLIIDDDPGVVDVVSLAIELRWPDAIIPTAESGESGLDKLMDEEPDGVILDIGLPGIDGFEVLETIRTGSDIPVIMLTAREDQESIARAFDLGANDYISKPFSTSILLARIEAAIRQHTQGE